MTLGKANVLAHGGVRSGLRIRSASVTRLASDRHLKQAQSHWAGHSTYYT
jgi:hypothetical protein